MKKLGVITFILCLPFLFGCGSNSDPEIDKPYTICWVDDKGNVLKKEKYDYGEMPTYLGDTPTSHDKTKSFIGWYPFITSVTSDITYTAQFSNMPILNFDYNGDLSDITKDDEVSVETKYIPSNNNQGGFEYGATIKLQGSSSLFYPKKNYTIKFDKKVIFNEAWGSHKKYCLKANYVDYSQARNIVSAKLYGQIVKNRSIEDELSQLPNGGAIDGFPIVLKFNNDFLGLYTLNIPKDEWLFNMTDTTKKQALLFGNQWSSTVGLKKPLEGEYSDSVDDIDNMELEYNSLEKSDYTWITYSFNNFVNFLLGCSTADDFKENCDNYIDLDRCIDQMLFTQFIQAEDNTAKNIIWATFDGMHWYPSVYDLDASWGLAWDGKSWNDPAQYLSDSLATKNNLWGKIYLFCSDAFKNRYKELRELDILDKDNIMNLFNEFNFKIDPLVKNLESEKYPDVPSKDTNNLKQIEEYVTKRLKTFDDVLLEGVKNIF